jgi:hypothetical protein
MVSHHGAFGQQTQDEIMAKPDHVGVRESRGVGQSDMVWLRQDLASAFGVLASGTFRGAFLGRAAGVCCGAELGGQLVEGGQGVGIVPRRGQVPDHIGGIVVTQ